MKGIHCALQGRLGGDLSIVAGMLLRDLLAENGSIYVHLDWHMAHYAKAVLAEVFGSDNFRSEVVWQKIRSSKAQSIGYGNVHDIIFFYSKGKDVVFNALRVPHSDDYLRGHYRYTEEGTGRRYRLHDFTQAGQGPARKFGKKEIEPPHGKHWIWSQKRIDEGMQRGLIVFSKEGMPSVKRYLIAPRPSGLRHGTSKSPWRPRARGE
jgi:adenine-specific DNA-methyltransferase